MSKKMIGTFYDHLTGECVVRELTDEEIAEMPTLDEFPLTIPPMEDEA